MVLQTELQEFLLEGLVRARREHGSILGRIRRLEEGAGSMRTVPDLQKAVIVRKNAAALLAELEEHNGWEERELVPALAESLRGQDGPDVLGTAWMLETNYRLAAELIGNFLRQTQVAAVPSAVPGLRRACALVKEQIELEELLLYTNM